jgi:hypothetical protein
MQAPFKAQKMIQPSTRNAEVWFDTIGIDHLKKLGWIQSKRSKLFGLKGEMTTVRFSLGYALSKYYRDPHHHTERYFSSHATTINAVLCFTMMPLRPAETIGECIRRTSK